MLWRRPDRGDAWPRRGGIPAAIDRGRDGLAVGGPECASVQPRPRHVAVRNRDEIEKRTTQVLFCGGGRFSRTSAFSRDVAEKIRCWRDRRVRARGSSCFERVLVPIGGVMTIEIDGGDRLAKRCRPFQERPVAAASARMRTAHLGGAQTPAGGRIQQGNKSWKGWPGRPHRPPTIGAGRRHVRQRGPFAVRVRAIGAESPVGRARARLLLIARAASATRISEPWGRTRNDPFPSRARPRLAGRSRRRPRRLQPQLLAGRILSSVIFDTSGGVASPARRARRRAIARGRRRFLPAVELGPPERRILSASPEDRRKTRRKTTSGAIGASALDFVDRTRGRRDARPHRRSPGGAQAHICGVEHMMDIFFF